jgi:hypothetical protein
MATYTGLFRNSNDEFYTKPIIAEYCIHKLYEILDSKYTNIYIDYFIEPSAGNGSFIKFLDNYIAFDIEPQGENIIKSDFLLLSIEQDWKESNVWTIGNPPFGRQSSLAKKFIKKACIYSKGIAFILPKSFRKESMFKAFDNYFHCIYDEELPKKSFLLNDKDYDVPCIFQIWIKLDVKREKKEIKETNDFIFVKKDENPDIAFRRVGGNAGKLEHNIDNCNPQCFYFLKLNIDKDLFINKIQNIIWNHNTVGPKSISKTELLEKYN